MWKTVLVTINMGLASLQCMDKKGFKIKIPAFDHKKNKETKIVQCSEQKLDQSSYSASFLHNLFNYLRYHYTLPSTDNIGKIRYIKNSMRLLRSYILSVLYDGKTPITEHYILLFFDPKKTFINDVGCVPIIRMLLEQYNGATSNFSSKEGITPLHFVLTYAYGTIEQEDNAEDADFTHRKYIALVEKLIALQPRSSMAKGLVYSSELTPLEIAIGFKRLPWYYIKKLADLANVTYGTLKLYTIFQKLNAQRYQQKLIDIPPEIVEYIQASLEDLLRYECRLGKGQFSPMLLC